MAYVDGFLIPIPKGKISQYKKIASKAGRIWRKYGALDYKECVGEDLNHKGFHQFQKAAKAKSNEAVVFSYIVYKSKKHRDAVNKKVMQDPWIKSMGPKEMPFDVKRMAYGGFKVIVDA